MTREELARLPTTVRSLYDIIEKQREALTAIKNYGYKHAGCGYTCASMADRALEDIKYE